MLGQIARDAQSMKQMEDFIQLVKRVQSTLNIEVDVAAAQKWLADRVEGQKLRDNMRALIPKTSELPTEQSLVALEAARAALKEYADSSIFTQDLVDAEAAIARLACRLLSNLFNSRLIPECARSCNLLLFRFAPAPSWPLVISLVAPMSQCTRASLSDAHVSRLSITAFVFAFTDRLGRPDSASFVPSC
jgi:hypothetical protein